MPVLPKKPLEKIEFFQAHQTPWLSHAADIGINPADMSTMDTKTTAAVEARAGQVAAMQAAKTATSAFKAAVAAMTDFGSDLIKQIKSKAATAGSGVYDLAEIPAPAAPSPVAAPGTPTEFVAKLLPYGFIEIGFKCVNPVNSQGTVYEVTRKLENGPYVTIATVGQKKFVDDTIPAGTAQATYGITAIRSTKKGTSAVFTVYLGVSESGEMTATIGPETTGAKLAA